MELYTAVGKAIGSQEQKLILQIGQRELVADQQESITWLFLNWKIYSKEMLTDYLAQQYPQLAEGRSYEDCLNRMVQRGILAKGSGQHPAEAHYRMFADLSILPMFDKKRYRWRAALNLLGKYPLREAVDMARPLILEDLDKMILRLIHSGCLSTAEIIAYMDKFLLHLDKGDQDYSGKNVTGEALLFSAEHSFQCMPVVSSLLRLYKQRAIIFDGPRNTVY